MWSRFVSSIESLIQFWTRTLWIVRYDNLAIFCFILAIDIQHETM